MNASKAHVLPHRWMRSIAAARSALLHRTVAVLLMLAVVATAGGCDREIGGWSQLADPPFKTREGAFAAALGDGRLLVWGGVREADGRCTGTAPVDGLGDGGIYDPTTNTWAYVPESPLRPFVPGPATGLEVQLADDRLAVVELYEDGTVHAAVYDVAAQRWDEAPRSEITPWEAVGWDGQTLTMLDRSARTVRWTPGSPVWTTAAQFPLAPRSSVEPRSTAGIWRCGAGWTAQATSSTTAPSTMCRPMPGR